MMGSRAQIITGQQLEFQVPTTGSLSVQRSAAQVGAHHGRKHYTQNIVDQVSCLSYQWKANDIYAIIQCVVRKKVVQSKQLGELGGY
jgi:hypothetical protein